MLGSIHGHPITTHLDETETPSTTPWMKQQYPLPPLDETGVHQPPHFYETKVPPTTFWLKQGHPHHPFG